MNVLHLSAMIALACFCTFHAILAFVMFDEITSRVVWYLGMDVSGAAVIAVNVLAIRGGPANDAISWRVCHGINLLALAYGTFFLIVVPDPATALGVVVELALIVGAVMTQRNFSAKV